MGFMDSLKKTLNDSFNSSVTENGAIGYRTSGKNLLDLNFSVSSLRNAPDEVVAGRFMKAFYDDKLMAVKWLFFASDVRGGLGERRLFRVCIRELAKGQPRLVKALLGLIPEYSRWDNLLCLFGTELEEEAMEVLKSQLSLDMEAMAEGKPVSLCAKWMPSANASSEESKRLAKSMIRHLKITERQYRKMLSALRAYTKVTETYMSSKRWEEIVYKAVPSRANLLYNKAFLRNDEVRRKAYLESLKKGETTIHAGVLYPHDIVHQYFEQGQQRWDPVLKGEDDTLEALWKALPDYVQGAGNTLCVSDGSGSMTASVGGTSVTCLDVANALSIYFSERCTGQFKDQYITFSENPQFVDLSNTINLREKIETARLYDEVANTNIEAVFELILETAKKNHMTQSEFPRTLLILSDMEFDTATRISDGGVRHSPDEALFETFRKRYESCGYKLPRLVFWNICSRTGTIPVKENKLGVALVSGFSVTIMKMVLSGKTDPYDCLLEQLNSDRYQAVEEALKEVI